jgi:transcriptional regulator with XRE-family HTH domain
MKDIGSLLECLGQGKGLAAKEMGLSRSYLYDIASGKRQPTVPMVGRVLTFLNRPEHLRKLGRRKRLTFEEVFGAGESQAEPSRKAS